MTGATGMVLATLRAPAHALNSDLRQGRQTPTAHPEGLTPLLELLGCLPNSLSDTPPAFPLAWGYADLALRFETLGLSPDDMPEPRLPHVLTATAPLAHTSNLFQYMDDEDFVTAIGFDPVHVQQVLSAGAPPERVTLLRGEWDVDRLPDAWEAAGYAQETAEGGEPVWSLGQNAEIDPTHPIQSRMFAELNNVTLLDRSILAFGSTFDLVERVIATQLSSSQSARDNADIAPLLGTLPHDTASLLAFNGPGSSLYDLEEMSMNPNINPADLEAIEAQFDESKQEAGAMPNFGGSLFGITAGMTNANGVTATPVTGTNDSSDGETIIVRLSAHSEEDAEQIARVVRWRWNNLLSGRTFHPFSAIMTLTRAEADGSVAVFSFEPIANPVVWINLLNSGDLAPFAVDSDV